MIHLTMNLGPKVILSVLSFPNCPKSSRKPSVYAVFCFVFATHGMQNLSSLTRD